MNKDNSILIASVIFPDNLCDEVINIFENKSKGFKDLRYFHRNQKGVRRKDEACFLDDFYIDLRNDNGDDNISDKNYRKQKKVVGFTHGITNKQI